MKNLWLDKEAAKYTDALALRVYSSRLLGQNSALVLHSGGNTSVKITEKGVVLNPDKEKIDSLFISD